YSSTYDDMSVNRIDIIDVASEEYAQEVLDGYVVGVLDVVGWDDKDGKDVILEGEVDGASP
ncbi:hypothetical protein Tco_0361985, partial [Tanacetum coccineum]